LQCRRTNLPSCVPLCCPCAAPVCSETRELVSKRCLDRVVFDRPDGRGHQRREKLDDAHVLRAPRSIIAIANTYGSRLQAPGQEVVHGSDPVGRGGRADLQTASLTRSCGRCAIHRIAQRTQERVDGEHEAASRPASAIHCAGKAARRAEKPGSAAKALTTAFHAKSPARPKSRSRGLSRRRAWRRRAPTPWPGQSRSVAG